MWSFFLSPITFVLELIGFLISAAFVYSLAFIAAMTLTLSFLKIEIPWGANGFLKFSVR